MDAYEAQDGAILGSLLLEPLVMGAGGMVFVDPLFQRILVQVKNVGSDRANLDVREENSAAFSGMLPVYCSPNPRLPASSRIKAR